MLIIAKALHDSGSQDSSDRGSEGDAAGSEGPKRAADRTETGDGGSRHLPQGHKGLPSPSMPDGGRPGNDDRRAVGHHRRYKILMYLLFQKRQSVGSKDLGKGKRPAIRAFQFIHRHQIAARQQYNKE